MGYAFISYSTKEQSSADSMKKLLKKQGIQTWMAPGDIPAGNKYAQVINKAIKGCSCLILMLSKNSQDSVWVSKEVERAVNYRKPIIPVQLEALTLNDEFELYISTDQVVAVKMIDDDSEEIQKILDSVKAIAGVEDNVQKTKQTSLDTYKESIVNSKEPDESTKITDNYYFKVMLSSKEGSLFLVSPESESSDSLVSTNITEATWDKFAVLCKNLLSSAFPGTPPDNISIKRSKPLGVYSCAPDDGHSYYDEKFRIDFKVSIVYKQMPKNYDSVRFDLGSDSFETSLYFKGHYVHLGINENQILDAAVELIHFAQRSNSIVVSDSFRKNFYSDGSGGYYLEFIKKDNESNEKYLIKIKNNIKPKVFVFSRYEHTTRYEHTKSNEVIILSSYTDIAKNSFSHVFIEKLKIPASIVRIHKNSFDSALIKEIYLSKNNKFYNIVNGKLVDAITDEVINTGSATLFKY